MMEKKFNFIYKTICIPTNEYYFGMHSCDVLDRYIGSGSKLLDRIKKYGRKNFSFEILEYFPTRDLLRSREREIVNEMLLTDPLCLNQAKGGGTDLEFRESKSYRDGCSKGGKIAGKLTHKTNFATNQSDAAKKKRAKTIQERGIKAFLGKSHSDQTKAIIGLKNSKHQSGSGNSQYGTCWVTDGFKPIKIRKDQLEKYVQDGWRQGRK